MPSTTANGITIHYETQGDPASPPLLLVMGLGAQLTTWPDEFVDLLVARGFFVIRHDNRDVGLSTWLDEAGTPDLAAAVAGNADAAYLLSDMADDAVGLLDALGIGSAHIVGASMGGMIAQAIAISHPQRVRSLVSIMSTTGAADVGQPRADIFPLLLRPVPTTREEAIEAGVLAARLTGSTGYPFDEAGARTRSAASYDRAFHPVGTGRQLVAILASGDRTDALGQLAVPTLVIHGEADPLVDVSGGKATAAAIPGSTLHLIPGMGHDLPAGLWERITDDIASHAHPHDDRLAVADSAI
ncbi:MAG: alpha/beta hydrolase [Acidimicrobiales bacterium]